MFNKIKTNAEVHQNFSIRKLTIGVVSVLLSTTLFWGTSTSSVKAAPENKGAQTSSSQVNKSESKAEGNSDQNKSNVSHIDSNDKTNDATVNTKLASQQSSTEIKDQSGYTSFEVGKLTSGDNLSVASLSESKFRDNHSPVTEERKINVYGYTESNSTAPSKPFSTITWNIKNPAPSLDSYKQAFADRYNQEHGTHVTPNDVEFKDNTNHYITDLSKLNDGYNSIYALLKSNTLSSYGELGDQFQNNLDKLRLAVKDGQDVSGSVEIPIDSDVTSYNTEISNISASSPEDLIKVQKDSTVKSPTLGEIFDPKFNTLEFYKAGNYIGRTKDGQDFVISQTPFSFYTKNSIKKLVELENNIGNLTADQVRDEYSGYFGIGNADFNSIKSQIEDSQNEYRNGEGNEFLWTANPSVVPAPEYNSDGTVNAKKFSGWYAYYLDSDNSGHTIYDIYYHVLDKNYHGKIAPLWFYTGTGSGGASNGWNYFRVYNTDTVPKQSKSVTEVVTYRNEDGTSFTGIVPTNAHQTVTFLKSSYLENDEGQAVTVGVNGNMNVEAIPSWQPDMHTFSEVISPAESGYQVDSVSSHKDGKNVAAIVVNHNSDSLQIEVAYKPVHQTVPKTPDVPAGVPGNSSNPGQSNLNHSNTPNNSTKKPQLPSVVPQGSTPNQKIPNNNISKPRKSTISKIKKSINRKQHTRKIKKNIVSKAKLHKTPVKSSFSENTKVHATRLDKNSVKQQRVDNVTPHSEKMNNIGPHSEAINGTHQNNHFDSPKAQSNKLFDSKNSYQNKNVDSTNIESRSHQGNSNKLTRTKLPQTNERQNKVMRLSILGLVAGTVLALFGFAGDRKRKKN